MNLIDLVKQKWKRIKFFESTIIAIAIAVVCLELLAVFSNLSSFVISTITFAAFIVSFFLITKIKAINAIKSADISSFLNTEFPQLQFSSQLIEQDDIVLTELARYQKQRLLSALPEIDSIKIPNQFKSLLIVLTGTLIFSLLIRFYGHDIVQTLSRSDHSTVINSAVSDKLLPVVLSEAEITIEAPVYTKIATKSQSDFNVLAPESSVLHFRFKFSAEIKRAFLLINQRDTIKLKVLESVVKTSYRLNHSGFYSILWQTEKQDFASDFYQLNVVKDQPPEIDINGLKSYSTVEYNQDLNFNFDILLTDDYGISASSIVATLGKGSGESVKFREQEIAVNQSFSDQLKSYTIRQNLDLKKLEMEPGDELFLFVKASDNKVPHHQSARTLTYIISMADTASYKAAVSAGLPVDRMPDYFRSQRQIIIDTEALIKQRPKLKHDSFMETSNNIGVDQKLLRLRYGKFFGEEFESQEFGIAAFDPNQADQHASDATVEPQTVTDPAMAMEIIADFVHDHDANEQDAFIEASVRILMKQALSNMWDAELHLRLGKPEKALPYEYQALELIKEATKKSRIYVERVGFEAPLLKPLENRYKGELDKISSQNKKSTSQKTDPFASIRLLIQLLDIDKTVQFDQSDIELIQAASTELAAVVDENPVIVLNALKSIRIAEESRRLKSEVAQSLKLLLNELLPDDTEQKHIEKQISNELQKRYLKELQKIQ